MDVMFEIYPDLDTDGKEGMQGMVLQVLSAEGEERFVKEVISIFDLFEPAFNSYWIDNETSMMFVLIKGKLIQIYDYVSMHEVKL